MTWTYWNKDAHLSGCGRGSLAFSSMKPLSKIAMMGAFALLLSHIEAHSLVDLRTYLQGQHEPAAGSGSSLAFSGHMTKTKKLKWAERIKNTLYSDKFLLGSGKVFQSLSEITFYNCYKY